MSVSTLIFNNKDLNNGNTFDPETVNAPYNKFTKQINYNLLGREIALQKLTIYNSFPNINATNNTFQISWDVGGTYTDVDVSIAVNTNFESISELNKYLQTLMIANGMYLKDASDNNVYYMTIIENSATYGVDIVQYKVPTSLPATYSEPSNFIGYPSVSKTMKLTTDTSDFNLLIGFAKSTVYNGNTTQTTFSNTITPQLNPVSSVYIKLNYASNELALNENDSSIIYTFTTAGVSYGSLIQIEPNNLVWFRINTTSNNIILNFTDQNNNELNILDPEMNALFLVR